MLPRTSRSTDVMLPASLPPRGEGAILVCDDDASIRTVVSEHLTRQGYTVIEAVSGEQALILAAEHHVEAILLDLYMPGLSGWETLQRLRNNPITANIPVVVLSVLSSTLRPQLTGDAQGWVQKPFNENLLFAELGRVLHHGEGPAYVLLVEDDEDLASVLTASFQDAAVRIDHASSRQALGLGQRVVRVGNESDLDAPAVRRDQVISDVGQVERVEGAIDARRRIVDERDHGIAHVDVA